MNAEQLRTLAIALATQVNAAENANGEVADVGPDGVCAIAIASAAQSFGTTRDAVLSADRHRAVTDARAVAMTAARRGGLTLPAIAAASVLLWIYHGLILLGIKPAALVNTIATIGNVVTIGAEVKKKKDATGSKRLAIK